MKPYLKLSTTRTNEIIPLLRAKRCLRIIYLLLIRRARAGATVATIVVGVNP